MANLTSKRYRIASHIDIRSIPNMREIVTLMMFNDALNSSLRWYRGIQSDDTPEASVDRLFSIVCGAGWAGEAICFLEKSKPVMQSVIDKLPELHPISPRDVWTECIETKPKPDVVKKLHAIRDMCFAHFDPKLAEAVIDDIAGGKVEPVFMEFSGEERLKSQCPVAWLAIVKHVFAIEDEIDKSKLLPVDDQVLKVGILLEHLCVALRRQARLDLEPCGEDG